METNSKTHWTSLILAFIAGAVLCGLVWFATRPPAPPPPPPQPKAIPKVDYACKDADVDVTLNKDPVQPDVFVLCQDRDSNQHYKVTWKIAPGQPPSLKSFIADFANGSPFEDANGNDQKVFKLNSPGTSVATLKTKQLTIPAGGYLYFKYNVTVCCDAQNHPIKKDPGGIIFP